MRKVSGVSFPPVFRLGLPRRLAAITALLALLLVAGATELALSLAERSRLADLRAESVDLATTLAAYLTRIAPTGEPSALAVGLAGWSRRHLTETTAAVFVLEPGGLFPAAASDSSVTRVADDLDVEAMSRRAVGYRFRETPRPAWQVAVPLGGIRVYGVLDVQVDTGRLDDWAREERRRAYALALAAALLLGLGVAILTSRWVGVPLRSLSRAMAGAHGGAEGAPPAPEEGPPEFRALARGYNDLRSALETRERESEAHAGLLALEERARFLDRQAQAEVISASYAHEIGTPLNTTNGHLQLLRDDLRRVGDAAGVERVELVLAQLDRVAKIVRGGLSRGGWPEPRSSATDLKVRAEGMLRFLEPSLAAAGVTAKLLPGSSNGAAVAWTDPELTDQIVLNLLKNAIEALKPGGEIVLRSGVEDGQAFLEISDNGPGLSPDARSQLFQPFVTSKGLGGTGLGLAVSRRLARALGGELAYVPSDRGTRWRLTLPARNEA
jgi:signal transduction histidine kinase